MSRHDHHPDDHDDHDLGLAHDLPRLIGRRRLLAILGGLGLAAPGLAQAAECVALPWETQGPYPADGSNARAGQTVNALAEDGILRTDIRSSFGTLDGTAQGVRLDLDLTLADAACTPLPGHAIYVWHCDGEGRYSLYDLPEQNFLRGVGVSDGDGRVRFTTIVPGCYDGRWPHIHFEVFETPEAAVSGDASILTAQIALPEDIVAQVYAADPSYPTSTRNLSRTSLSGDNVFGDNTAAQIAQQTLAMTGDPAQGYAGTLTIPIDPDADRATMMPPPGGPGGRPPRN